MNWIETTTLIYKNLENHGFLVEKEELFDAQLSGGTGGEIFLEIVVKLLDFKKNKPDVFRSIKAEAEAIINYGIEIGYINKIE